MADLTGSGNIKLFLHYRYDLFTAENCLPGYSAALNNTPFVPDKIRTIFIDGLPQSTLTFLHIVRIPVELVLYWLFLHQAVPELMTFSGRNFDILAGITAPFVAYYGLQKQLMGRKTLITWNLVALALLFNIVIHAVLSAPFAFQQLAFDQPNIAVLYFPFSWLPGFIVPVVLFAHLVSVRQLLKYEK